MHFLFCAKEKEKGLTGIVKNDNHFVGHSLLLLRRVWKSQRNFPINSFFLRCQTIWKKTSWIDENKNKRVHICAWMKGKVILHCCFLFACCIHSQSTSFFGFTMCTAHIHEAVLFIYKKMIENDGVVVGPFFGIDLINNNKSEVISISLFSRNLRH